jgi:hypothetical protein
MRELEKHAHRAELGEHRDRQDGHDCQQGAKLGTLLVALIENLHGSLHRVDFFKSQFWQSMSEPDMKSAA